VKHLDLDISSLTKPLKHYWELCVGSCHATTALREDYRQQLSRCHRELGFQYVRFHGLFDSVLLMAET
jgi:xylan 1,4-beta-xylosidase